MGFKVNFEGISDDLGEAGPPPGTYLCRVAEACERTSKGAAGTYLNFALYVAEGEYEGRRAGFEKLFFHTAETLKRAKFVLRRLGVDVDASDLEIEPETLNGVLVQVTTQADPKCPDCKWDVVLKEQLQDGTKLYRCKKDECGWQGPEEKILPYTSPTYNGYEAVEQTAGAAAGGRTDSGTSEKDVKDIPF